MAVLVMLIAILTACIIGLSIANIAPGAMLIPASTAVIGGALARLIWLIRTNGGGVPPAAPPTMLQK